MSTPFGYIQSEGGAQGPQGLRGLQGVGISSITFIDNNNGTVDLTFNMSDATTHGPYTSSLISDTINVSSLTINSAYTLPSSDGTAGYTISTDGVGNLSWSTNSLQTSYNNTVDKTLIMENDLLVKRGCFIFNDLESDVFQKSGIKMKSYTTVGTNWLEMLSDEKILIRGAPLIDKFRIKNSSDTTVFNITGEGNLTATKINPIGLTADLGSAGDRWNEDILIDVILTMI